MYARSLVCLMPRPYAEPLWNPNQIEFIASNADRLDDEFPVSYRTQRNKPLQLVKDGLGKRYFYALSKTQKNGMDLLLECKNRKQAKCPAKLKVKLYEAEGDQFKLNSYDLGTAFLYCEHNHGPEDDNSIDTIKYFNLAKKMADTNSAGVIIRKINQCLKDENRSQNDIATVIKKPSNMRKVVSRKRVKIQQHKAGNFDSLPENDRYFTHVYRVVHFQRTITRATKITKIKKNINN